MARITNGNYVTSPVPNTTMLEKLRDGVLYMYVVAPVEGYCLHDKMGDWTDSDPNTMEETYKQAFYTRSCSCLATYDFTPVEMLDPNGNTVTAYGDREFYTLPLSDTPGDQVFGGVNPDHEIM